MQYNKSVTSFKAREILTKYKKRGNIREVKKYVSYCMSKVM